MSLRNHQPPPQAQAGRKQGGESGGDVLWADGRRGKQADKASDSSVADAVLQMFKFMFGFQGCFMAAAQMQAVSDP